MNITSFPAAELADMDIESAIDTLVDHVATVGGSDLFIHSDEVSTEIAMRRLGMVERLAIVSPDQGRHMIAFVKAMAGMNITEHRRPLDGRWIRDTEDRRVDLRINTVATLFGEDLTIRVWDRNVGLKKIDELGMYKKDLNKLETMLSSPSGLILVTGPTGTGKTTTLYACLQHLKDGNRKICTLEDPVEFAVPGIRQAQIAPRIGLDFSQLLRGIMRQSPDIILLGEIRDEETALTAIRAASSGHLVLASLHAPVASAALQSMLALKSNAYFLSSCLLGVIAQRLVRTLCENCRVAFDVTEAPETFQGIQEQLAPGEGEAIYGPTGCEECNGLGYSGRTGIFEIMTLSQRLRKLIKNKSSREEIEAAAIEGGMLEFQRAAMIQVARGVTSAEEILRDVPPEYLGLED